jgi:fatty-acyl-CoA synthase
LGVGAAARPQVQADGDSALKIIVDSAAVGAQAQALQNQLQQALGRLPVKAQVILK